MEKGLYRKRMLSYGGLLKQKHKILNLDEAEDGNLIYTSDEDKAHSIMIIFKFACKWTVSKNHALVLLKFLFVK